MFAYIGFERESSHIAVLGVYNTREQCKRYWRKKKWNPRVAGALKDFSIAKLISCEMTMNYSDGVLWLQMSHIHNDKENVASLRLLPFDPFSMEVFTPYFGAIASPFMDIDSNECNALANKFGSLFFNMSFNKETNLQFAIKQENVGMIHDLCIAATQHNTKISLNVPSTNIEKRYKNLLMYAVEKKASNVTKAVLEIIKHKNVAFSDGAKAIKECFQDLWINDQKLAEWMLTNNILSWDVLEFEAPLSIFTNNMFITARVGACNYDFLWIKNVGNEEILSHWKELNKNIFRSIERSGISTTTNAKVTAFCMRHICKTGLNGIIRFLLLQDAPSYIFKTPVVKWVIVWKWEHKWKSYTQIHFICYLCFLVGFTIYAFRIGVIKEGIRENLTELVFLTILLLCLVVWITYSFYQELLQISTYLKDGKTLFPNDNFWGIKYYARSKWNLLEASSYIIMLLIVLPYHFARLVYSPPLAFLYGVLALETILLWIKVWYYAQAFQRTGALVLLIENVIQDCVPFLLLASAVLVAFGSALFVLFQYSQDEHKQVIFIEGDTDIKEKIQAGFGTPLRAILTLFYAMIGTFEQEIYLESGVLAPVIIITLVVYLIIQMIVIFNMLIAIMGDTFDKVKSKEEEQLLMGRGRYIDACEASLTQSETLKMEQNLKRYLCVLYPLTEYSEESNAWKGKMQTIEELGKKMLEGFEHIMKEGKSTDTLQLAQQLDDVSKEIKQLDRRLTFLQENMSIAVDNQNIRQADVTTIQSLKDYINHKTEDLTKDLEGKLASFQDEMRELMSMLQAKMTNTQPQVHDDTRLESSDLGSCS